MRTDLPLDIHFSFEKLLEAYRREAAGQTSEVARTLLTRRLDYVEQFQELSQSWKDTSRLLDLADPIGVLLQDFFPPILSLSELKAVSVPFHHWLFHPSAGLQKILEAAGPDYRLSANPHDPDQDYIRACILILNSHYGYNIEDNRPVHYEIPDREGMLRRFLVQQTTQFYEIIPTSKSKGITRQDVELLLGNREDLDLWKQYFPAQSWTFKGFSMIHLTDVTQEEAISQLKWSLLNTGASYNEDVEEFQNIFRSIFRVADLEVGFSFYDSQEGKFQPMGRSQSFLGRQDPQIPLYELLGPEGYKRLLTQKENFILPSLEQLPENSGQKTGILMEQLQQAGKQSAIFAPITRNKRLFGVLELTSGADNQLNGINAARLDEIMPYMVTAVERNVAEFENRIKAVIQNECTSIHPSVLWRFEKEARRFIEQQDADGMASFRDIVFPEVHPLYGQIDIVASSQARNEAIQQDFLQQLKALKQIMQKARDIEEMELYDQIIFRLNQFIEDLQADLNGSSEQQVFNLIDREINPVLEHLVKIHPQMKTRVEEYQKMISTDTGLVYDRRQDYDSSVQIVNQNMARYLDKKQQEAQQIYPHYFERYKTDGVDHNIYIGGSLCDDQEKPFDEIYLYGIRLWQLKTMCEMENRFYQLQERLPMTLEAASLILVFSNTLSIRYRMDEKRFDVDGTYNARYEIIKKRIDKACILGTEERVAQKGKIAIVYSLRKDQREYLRYIKYLQSKGYLGPKVELLELEDVQGVVGLKAIRVEVLYHTSQDGSEDGITYQDLLDQQY